MHVRAQRIAQVQQPGASALVQRVGHGRRCTIARAVGPGVQRGPVQLRQILWVLQMRPYVKTRNAWRLKVLRGWLGLPCTRFTGRRHCGGLQVDLHQPGAQERQHPHTARQHRFAKTLQTGAHNLAGGLDIEDQQHHEQNETNQDRGHGRMGAISALGGAKRILLF